MSKILGVVAALSIAFYSIFASAGPSSQRDTLEGDEAIGNASIDWQNVATDLAFHHKVDGIAQGFYPTLGARWKKSGDSFLGVQIDVRTDMSVGLREITGQSALFAGKTESQAIQLSLGRPEPGSLEAAPSGMENHRLYLVIERHGDGTYGWSYQNVTKDEYWKGKQDYDSTLHQYIEQSMRDDASAKHEMDDIAKGRGKNFQNTNTALAVGKNNTANAFIVTVKVNMQTGEYDLPVADHDVGAFGRTADEALRLQAGFEAGPFLHPLLQTEYKDGYATVKFHTVVEAQRTGPITWNVPPDFTPEFLKDAATNYRKYLSDNYGAQEFHTGLPPKSNPPQPSGARGQRGVGTEVVPIGPQGPGNTTGCDTPNCIQMRP